MADWNPPSSTIGEFVIGESAIGTPGFHWPDTIYSQYANSPTLLALIESFADAVNPAGLIDDFYDNVWNILTAKGYGLDVWGRIVGISRVLQLPSGGQTLGYKEAGGAEINSFGLAKFFFGVPAGSSYTLADDAYRTLILVKALTNISNCAIPTYNKILRQLFAGRGNAFVSDTGNMTAVLVFMFELQSFELAIVKYSGAIANPTGVGFNIMQYTPGGFGFQESGAASTGFGTGTFFGGFL